MTCSKKKTKKKKKTVPLHVTHCVLFPSMHPFIVLQMFSVAPSAYIYFDGHWCLHILAEDIPFTSRLLRWWTNPGNQGPAWLNIPDQHSGK